MGERAFCIWQLAQLLNVLPLGVSDDSRAPATILRAFSSPQEQATSIQLGL
jgi:hypothetical protein